MNGVWLRLHVDLFANESPMFSRQQFRCFAQVIKQNDDNDVRHKPMRKEWLLLWLCSGLRRVCASIIRLFLIYSNARLLISFEQIDFVSAGFFLQLVCIWFHLWFRLSLNSVRIDRCSNRFQCPIFIKIVCNDFHFDGVCFCFFMQSEICSMFPFPFSPRVCNDRF